MYKLYNVKAWGSLAIHCILEEMEVPYTNIWMTAEQVRAPEFRQTSPSTRSRRSASTMAGRCSSPPPSSRSSSRRIPTDLWPLSPEAAISASS